MSGKPVAEQEIGFALLQEVVVPETSMSGENFYYFFGENLTVKQVKVLIWTNVRNQK
jgi:ATP-dependent DNA helicase RecQ